MSTTAKLWLYLGLAALGLLLWKLVEITHGQSVSSAGVLQDHRPYGALYNVSSNHPTERLVLEQRGVDRGTGPEEWRRVYPGNSSTLLTNPVVGVPGWLLPGEAAATREPLTYLLTITPSPWDGTQPGVPQGELVISRLTRTKVNHMFAEGYYTNRQAREPVPVRGTRIELAPPVTNMQGMIEFRDVTSDRQRKLGDSITTTHSTVSASNLITGRVPQARPIWEQPHMAEASLQWEPSPDALYYRIYAKSARTTNEWITKPEWAIYASPAEALINRTIVLDLSVPTETRITAVGANTDHSAPIYIPVPAIVRPQPPRNGKHMTSRTLAEAMAARRGRAEPVFVPPLPP